MQTIVMNGMVNRSLEAHISTGGPENHHSCSGQGVAWTDWSSIQLEQAQVISVDGGKVCGFHVWPDGVCHVRVSLSPEHGILDQDATMRKARVKSTFRKSLTAPERFRVRRGKSVDQRQMVRR